MTSKQRAYLMSLASKLDPVFHMGKASLTTEFEDAIKEVLETKELIKISVLKNCADDPKEIAQILAKDTRSEVVQVIGKKIVLYKQADEPAQRKLKLPVS
ncbi:MAG: ribosome assembly RNA-binding protein YhbY [Lachnospiraceae bacterium]|nr:ribosome assembly RNA-binding protein YhbY [Lachnospiraceae bacterium]